MNMLPIMNTGFCLRKRRAHEGPATVGTVGGRGAPVRTQQAGPADAGGRSTHRRLVRSHPLRPHRPHRPRRQRTSGSAVAGFVLSLDRSRAVGPRILDRRVVPDPSRIGGWPALRCHRRCPRRILRHSASRVVLHSSRRTRYCRGRRATVVRSHAVMRRDSVFRPFVGSSQMRGLPPDQQACVRGGTRVARRGRPSDGCSTVSPTQRSLATPGRTRTGATT